LTRTQTHIIEGAFELANCQVYELAMQYDRAFTISSESLLDQTKVSEIKRRGFTRVPVYYKENKNYIVGILIVKSLIGYDLSHPRTIS